MADDKQAIDWPDQIFLTVAEAAEIFRVDPRTLRRSLEAGVVPGVKIGAQWRLPVEQLRKKFG